MDCDAGIKEREQKLKDLKSLLRDIDEKLLSIANEFHWDYNKLLEEVNLTKKPSSLVTCSVNSQHKVPVSKIKLHEERCALHHQGYADVDKTFPEHSGTGSFVTFTPELLHSVTEKVPSSSVFTYVVFVYFNLIQIKTNQEKSLRALPQSSANFDQNFNREEKLAIYDYVIANTRNERTYSDLCLQTVEKTEEKKEMAPWEIAAAERDAKRRRASYRNKVHTNRKTHTEILREVINSQMEAFKSESESERTVEKIERHKTDHGNPRRESTETAGKRKQEAHARSNKDERDNRKSHDRRSKHREHKRSPTFTGTDSKSGSRSDDKYRKWKTYDGRSHSHRSSHTHRR